MASSPDVLRLIDRLVAATPPDVHYCRPLPRSTMVRVADEIRTLRQQLAAATQATPEAHDATSN